jgi:hypothetical protein
MSTINILPAIPASRRSDEDLPASLFLRGWSGLAGVDLDVVCPNQDAQPLLHAAAIPVRSRIARRLEVRRINRAFRRDQRQFDSVMDACASSPNAQRELKLSWDVRL